MMAKLTNECGMAMRRRCWNSPGAGTDKNGTGRTTCWRANDCRPRERINTPRQRREAKRLRIGSTVSRYAGCPGDPIEAAGAGRGRQTVHPQQTTGGLRRGSVSRKRCAWAKIESGIGGSAVHSMRLPKISRAEISRMPFPLWFLPVFTSRMKRQSPPQGIFLCDLSALVGFSQTLDRPGGAFRNSDQRRWRTPTSPLAGGSSMAVCGGECAHENSVQRS
jgi:hypothetical protein